MKKHFHLFVLAVVIVLQACSDDDNTSNAPVSYFEFQPEATVRLPVWVQNPSATGTAIIIVHGGPGVGAIGIFDPEQTIVPKLADDNLVVLYDQRSAGGLILGSADQDLSIERHAADLKALVDEVKSRYKGIDKIVLVGHSWGVPLSVKFAATYPAACDGLVLGDGLLSEYFNVQAEKDWLVARLNEAVEAGFGEELGVVNPETGLLISFEEGIGVAGSYPSSPHTILSSLSLRLMVNSVGGELVKGMSPEEYLTSYDYSFTPKPFSLDIIVGNQDISDEYKINNLLFLDLTEDAKAVSKPILCIYGEDDGVVPSTNADYIKSAVSTPSNLFRVSIIPSATHFPQNDNPAAYTAAIKNFLQLIQ